MNRLEVARLIARVEHKSVGNVTISAHELACLCDAYDALHALVAKLDAIEASESFRGIWVYLHAHNYTYSGPTWKSELARAREVTK